MIFSINNSDGICFRLPYFLTQFEADRRAFIITLNSFGTELTNEDRKKLYPQCGKLNPDGLAALARADDAENVKQVAEFYTVRFHLCMLECTSSTTYILTHTFNSYFVNYI